jgi:hypothetical protein
VLAAHVDGRLRRAGGVDGEPRRTRSLVATVGAHASPHRSLNREGDVPMLTSSAAARPLTVNTELTLNRPADQARPKPSTRRSRRRRDDVENPDYAAFARRVIRAHGRRVAGGDVEGLADLLALADELEVATRTAVEGLRGFGYSWAEIASRLGMTRQAAQQRWGRAAR